VVDRQFADPRLAALYDTLHPLDQAVRDFYLPLILGAPAVLDAGCGSGALLKEARRAGHRGRLCGLDPAAAMLAQARLRDDIEWREGDLGGVPWSGEFDLIVMTGHAFQCLLTDAELRAALAAVRRALKRAGRFIFETRNPGARAWERWHPRHAVEIADQHGNTVRVTLEVESQYDGRTVGFVETYSCVRWAEPLACRSELRFLEAPVLRRFLLEAGLTVEAQFGDFARGPLTATSPEIVTIASAR
jgi:SAM-dependent methyltransferase